MIARLAPVFVVFALAGCASMSSVTAVNKDRYQVTHSSGAEWMTWVELKNQALKRAEQYCQEDGRKLVKPEITSNHATGLTPKRATVTFQCEAVQPPKQPAS
ncbi:MULTISPECIES: hypothetical protein [unclassified Achromobacter]|uniref:hypothetical protein n=1 Tax=unclassified Achromobacter TaxID=2626865 RepID=UPI00069D39BD|nr:MULTISPECIES: hypothetical protein [unclassified Achromobacter]